MVIYPVYSSKYNKETIITLKEVFTLDEFMAHKEFITISEDLEAEAYTEKK